MGITEYRQEGKIRHKLIDILFIAVAATIANADGWLEMELFAKANEEWLRKYLELPYGIPLHDTIRRVFENIDSAEFEKCFINWISSISSPSKGSVIAIDGKTLRRSFDTLMDKTAAHIVNACTDDNNLILGQIETDKKSNEITAIPKLLDLLFIKDEILYSLLNKLFQ